MRLQATYTGADRLTKQTSSSSTRRNRKSPELTSTCRWPVKLRRMVSGGSQWLAGKVSQILETEDVSDIEVINRIAEEIGMGD